MMKISEMPKYEAYKDSGVEWIGAIPVHWNSFPLCAKSKLKSISNNENEELLSVYLDKGVIKFDDVDAKRTNTTSSDLTKYQLVDPGDFVLNNQQAWRGSVGVSDYRGIVSPAYLVLSLSEDIVPRFGNYLFRDGAMVANYLVSSKGVGTIQRNLYWPQLKRALVFLPPTEEQLLIACFLDKKTALIDEAISIKEKQINLLKERKQIIIQQAVTQGLDPNVPMKDSGVDWIGKIPEHWEVKKVKHFGRIRSGDSITNSELLDEGLYEVFGGNGLMGFSNYFNVEGDTIVIGRVGALCGNVRYINEKKWISDNALVLKLVGGLDYQYAQQLLAIADLNKLNSSNAQPLITGTKVLNFSVPIPPVGERSTISQFILEQDKLIETTIGMQQHQIEKLKEYKTTLINSAVTGKIKITPEMVEQ